MGNIKSKYIYSIGHTKEYTEDWEQIKTLGFFTSRAKAKQALEKYKQLPGFKYDTKEELFIAREVLDLSFWDGGFTTVAEIMSAYGTVIYEDEKEEFTEIVIDLPYWVKDQQQSADETSGLFAERLIKEKYNTDDYPKGPQSEFFQIKKFKDLIKN
jgi:hypothetical protein